MWCLISLKLQKDLIIKVPYNRLWVYLDTVYCWKMKILYVILIDYTIQICPAQSAYKLVLVPIANKSLVDWHHSHLNSSKIKPKLTLILISNIVITSSPKLLIIYELWL